MQIVCKTNFDCTNTGITGRFQASRLPTKDINNNLITDDASWNKARNQQRNLETLIQLISLRSQPLNLSTPIKNGETWEFYFETETPMVYGQDFVDLYADCLDVPMITGLTESTDLAQYLIPKTNIWFAQNS
jgi:hypothetical protein